MKNPAAVTPPRKPLSVKATFQRVHKEGLHIRLSTNVKTGRIIFTLHCISHIITCIIYA